jgi:hypothetical protein
MSICFIITILHLISIIVPIITTIVENASVQMLLYWLSNIISPSINAQVIVTYILAQKSAFCKLASVHIKKSAFESIGDDTMGWNYLILVLHILLFLSLIIIIDTGLLKFSFSFLYKSNFDESTLDDDVLAEHSRILDLQTNIVDDDDDAHIDYLTVNDLVKYYPRRKILAVNHLTFGAKRGEAFGLLGYNVSIEKNF